MIILILCIQSIRQKKAQHLHIFSSPAGTNPQIIFFLLPSLFPAVCLKSTQEINVFNLSSGQYEKSTDTIHSRHFRWVRAYHVVKKMQHFELQAQDVIEPDETNQSPQTVFEIKQKSLFLSSQDKNSEIRGNLPPIKRTLALKANSKITKKRDREEKSA